MSKQISRDVLQQHWVHSYEEDTDTEMVFRPASYDFPLSRGRKSFELKPDGSLIEHGFGPTDRRQKTLGEWGLEGDRIAFHMGPESESSRIMQIASADNDRLVLKK